MKSGRLHSPLPDIGNWVKMLMQDKNLSVPELARRMNVHPQVVYRLLKRKDWRISEIMLVGNLLNTPLIQYYTPNQNREAVEKDALIKAQRAEIEQLKKENALLREIAGAGK